ncbi:hypothetical protein NL676_003968 [Syzygium grande]|nr:hypothetical protein NL676_003968 [Syzygium grande]
MEHLVDLQVGLEQAGGLLVTLEHEPQAVGLLVDPGPVHHLEREPVVVEVEVPVAVDDADALAGAELCVLRGPCSTRSRACSSTCHGGGGGGRGGGCGWRRTPRGRTLLQGV